MWLGLSSIAIITEDWKQLNDVFYFTEHTASGPWMQVRLLRQTNRSLYPDWTTDYLDCLLVFIQRYLLVFYVTTHAQDEVEGWCLTIRLSFYPRKNSHPCGTHYTVRALRTKYTLYTTTILVISLLHTSFLLYNYILNTVYALDYKKYSSWIIFWTSKGPLTMFTYAIFVAQLNAILSRLF